MSEALNIFLLLCVDKNCLWGASNVADGVTQHQSVVLYHINSPAWFEMIKVSLPIDKYYGAHLRLEYRHCSSKT